MLAILPLLCMQQAPAAGLPMDVAPFSLPLRDGVGLMWEDPREIHRVVVRFKGDAPDPAKVRLEYWGSHWPEQRLPKDREIGGGFAGWFELGNWHNGGWRQADTTVRRDGDALSFEFNPVNAKEHPEFPDVDARYRFTLKLRVVCPEGSPSVRAIEAYSDSLWRRTELRVSFKAASGAAPRVEAHNGRVIGLEPDGEGAYRVGLWASSNPDPNTFDGTLVTIRRGKSVSTVALKDVEKEPMLVPSAGLAVAEGSDARGYADIEAAIRAKGQKSLVDRVAEMPEQTWKAAWDGMPAKRRRIYIPLGLDGGRQRFQLHGNGEVVFRTNDHYLRARPGKDTPRLDLEPGRVEVRFGLPGEPVDRTIVERSLPICVTTWEKDGVRIEQTAFVTPLEGCRASGPVPDADATAVFVARFVLRNPAAEAKTLALRLARRAGDKPEPWTVEADGTLVADGRTVGHVSGPGSLTPGDDGALDYRCSVPAGGEVSAVVKLAYIPLTEPAERLALANLNYYAELQATTQYWRRRLDESMKLITPEPMLNEYYRAHAGHLLINCEREPGSTNRFARVGSFGYGAYGNESCMMVVDLDRRGYHKEAEECLDGWLKFQGTVGLPGDFSTTKGVLYGAGGYEAGGYNQHHGWILWCMAEHYRFTHDDAWLRRAAPGILAGAEWIMGERKRTAKETGLGRGLLPAGSLEDIGDWWFWLSTNCYTWRGLDSAAWALERIDHPDAPRLRKDADEYHAALLKTFRAASDRSPVVRLRDGTAVPYIPSHATRRGRSYGWICETLEGSLHLLIAGVIDPRSKDAEWIIKDFEDNRYLSSGYGYVLDDFDRYWFGRGGMSNQACLLFHVEPYLYRDQVKNALRGIFNAIAVSLFPDVCMQTEHALPNMGDWFGDHYKSSDESNSAGWLRQLFVRESGEDLFVGQAVPTEWLAPGKRCGVERAETHFGTASVIYEAGADAVTATLDGPTRSAPKRILLRFRLSDDARLTSVTVNGKPWKNVTGNTVVLPGSIGHAVVVARRPAGR